MGDAPNEAEPRDRPIGLILAAAAVAAAVALPIVWIVRIAFGVEPARAEDLLFSARTAEILLRSVALVGVVTVGTVALGVPFAYLTVRTDLPYPRVFTVLLALPLVVPSYLGAFAVASATGPNGLLERTLGTGVPEISGFAGAAVVITLYTYPYVFLTTRAGLRTFDDRLLDAARVLSIGRWRRLKTVLWPNLRPAVSAGALLAALYAISDFGTPAIMRVDVYTRAIYVEFHTLGYEYAALLSVQLLVLALVIVSLESLVSGERAVRPTIGGPGSGQRHRLGRWRWPIAVGCLLVPLISLAGPIAVFASWLASGVSTVPGYAFEWSYAVNSILVSVAAAAVAAAMAIPVAYLVVRHRSVLSTSLERITYVGFAVPGIVLGLALVFLGTSFTGVLYPTIPLLVFAYVVRFLPQSVGTTRTSIVQIDDRLLEAGRVLGRSRLSVFRSITLPLIAPGILAGAALVFLTAMRELPATVMLRPTGFETLATHIWVAHEAAYHGQAALPALILIGVSALSMLVLLQQERRHDE